MGTKNGLFPQVTPKRFFFILCSLEERYSHRLGTTLEHLNKTGVMQIGGYLEKIWIQESRQALAPHWLRLHLFQSSNHTHTCPLSALINTPKAHMHTVIPCLALSREHRLAYLSETVHNSLDYLWCCLLFPSRISWSPRYYIYIFHLCI